MEKKQALIYPSLTSTQLAKEISRNKYSDISNTGIAGYPLQYCVTYNPDADFNFSKK